jgi:hypothetical protein
MSNAGSGFATGPISQKTAANPEAYQALPTGFPSQDAPQAQSQKNLP